MNSSVHHHRHPNGDESFFQAHAENLSALVECERETKKQTQQEMLERLKQDGLKIIREEKWRYETK